MSGLAARVVAAFRSRFHRAPRLFRAPGRVNLIGEHTDYNEGFVFPAAIDLATIAASAPRDDRRIRAISLDEPGELDAAIDDLRPSDHWTAYVAGVAALLNPPHGADIVVGSDVPTGGGLSSSAALEVSVALALGGGSAVSKIELARICQRAENEYAGMRCGIMDQFTSLFGKEGHALRLDCRDLTYETVPIPNNIRLVVANTMVKHELAASAYNQRRAACESAAAKLGASSLRGVEESSFLAKRHFLSDEEIRCATHVLTENDRVLRFARALRAGNLEEAGALMAASHVSLRDQFRVSCRELDVMVDIAASLPGVYGARMTGGGFGGCTINLVDAAAVPNAVERLREGYRQATAIDSDIRVCTAGPGASEITP